MRSDSVIVEKEIDTGIRRPLDARMVPPWKEEVILLVSRDHRALRLLISAGGKRIVCGCPMMRDGVRVSMFEAAGLQLTITPV